MALLIDLFGYLSVVLHGVTIVAQSMAIGGTLFLVFLARPFITSLADGAGLARRTAMIAGWSALGLVACEAIAVAMQAAVLADTVGLGLATARAISSRETPSAWPASSVRTARTRSVPTRGLPCSTTTGVAYRMFHPGEQRSDYWNSHD